VKPKYRGPNGELWTGRGRSPKWVEQIKANGESIEKYLIEQ
jgi:DNA-binding protein H-NS